MTVEIIKEQIRNSIATAQRSDPGCADANARAHVFVTFLAGQLYQVDQKLSAELVALLINIKPMGGQ